MMRGLSSNNPIKFQPVCVCMSMYMWELFTRAFSKTLFPMKGHTSELAQSQFQRNTSNILISYVFENFDLLPRV